MSKVTLLHTWIKDPELARLQKALSDGDNYVVWSLNREFRYLLHNIARVYDLRSLSYRNLDDAKTARRSEYAYEPCKWCIKDGVDRNKCKTRGSKTWLANNFLVITPTQDAMHKFIAQLESRYGASHNITKGLRNDDAPKFSISDEFSKEVKLHLPIIIGTPKDNPTKPFLSAEAKKVHNENITKELFEEINRSNIDTKESILSLLKSYNKDRPKVNVKDGEIYD
jgi:hypothetical protein